MARLECVGLSSLGVADWDIYLTHQVHNEAIVIPETVDATRTMSGLERDGARSIGKTDAALGVRKGLVNQIGEAIT